MKKERLLIVSFYLVMLSPLVFYSLIYRKNISKIRDTIIYSIIIFVLAFNYRLGTDWINYQYFYNQIIPELRIKNLLLNNTTFERGYVLYNYLIKNIFNVNYEIFMGITVSICCYILFFKIKKESRNYYLAIYIYITNYLFFASIEPVVRQLIAITIIVLGLKYIDEKKFFKFAVMIFISSQFHSSAILFIGIYFIDKINLNIKKTIVIFIFLHIIIYNLEFILNHIKLLDKYLVYFQKSRYAQFDKSLKGLLILIFKMIVYLYIIFFGYEKFQNKKNYIKNMAIIGVILMQYYNIFPILYRIQQYFLFFMVIGISYIFNLKKINLLIKKVLIFSLLCINGFIFFKTLTRTELNRYRYLPYKNYFIESIKSMSKEEVMNKKKTYIYNLKRLLIK